MTMFGRERDDPWDVLIVGAGPAGALAARGLAAAGARVLLVDKAQFPRWKVCGCCLNGAALQTLASVGLGALAARCHAPALTRFDVAARGARATLDLAAGVALTREALDSALIKEARAAGAVFAAGCSAAWRDADADGIVVELRDEEGATRTHARAVIAADGLTAGFTRGIPGVRVEVARRPRIGAGVSIADGRRDYRANTIYMAVAARGYVGLVRVEDDRLNIAAALDAEFVRNIGGLGGAAAAILAESGLPPVPGLDAARWKGTPPLTRRHIVPAHPRLFVIGDAAEYVEPFTGEGMAWALAGGAAVVEPALAAIRGDAAATQRAWRAASAKLNRPNKWRCRLLTQALRYPRLTALGLRVIRTFPRLANPYLRTLAGAR